MPDRQPSQSNDAIVRTEGNAIVSDPADRAHSSMYRKFTNNLERLPAGRATFVLTARAWLEAKDLNSPFPHVAFQRRHADSQLPTRWTNSHVIKAPNARRVNT